MRLISVELTGLKRFEQTTKINLDGKLIALVGPNEAGKTSILDALGWFGSDEPLPRSEWTRATAPDPNDVAVEALWLRRTCSSPQRSSYRRNSTAPGANRTSSLASRMTVPFFESSSRPTTAASLTLRAERWAEDVHGPRGLHGTSRRAEAADPVDRCTRR
jgi:hypothetical protein